MTEMHTIRQQAAQVLRVKEDAADEQVRAAFRRLARETHPDVPGGDPEAFQRATWAAGVLVQRPQAGWVAGQDEAPAAAEQGQAQQTTFRLGVHVQPGAVVWLRSSVRVRGFAKAVVVSSVLVAAAVSGWPELTVPMVIPIVLVLLGSSLHGAVGRPHWRTAVTDAAGRVRSRVQGDSASDESAAETGPIPAMTEERMREYERTGQ